MRFAFGALTLAIASFLAFLLQVPHREGVKIDLANLPEVRVALHGTSPPVTRIPSVDDPDDALVGVVDVRRPHRMIVRFPEGNSVTVICKGSSLTSVSGIRCGVTVLRPFELVRFEAALADLRRTIEEMGFEPDARTLKWFEDLESLPEQPKDPYAGDIVLPPSYNTSFDVTESVTLEIELTTARSGWSQDGRTRTGGGWFYTIGFSSFLEPAEIAEDIKKLIAIPATSPTLDQLEEGEGVEQPVLTVLVHLVGSIEEVEGIDQHPRLAKVARATVFQLEPHRLTLRLPGVGDPRFNARATAHISRYGLVEVVLVRPAAESDGFADARAGLDRALQALGTDAAERLADQITVWPDEASGIDEFGEPPCLRARADLSEVVNLEVQVRQDLEGAWSPLLIFRASEAARKANALPPLEVPPQEPNVDPDAQSAPDQTAVDPKAPGERKKDVSSH